jgi:hypothetical protein
MMLNQQLNPNHFIVVNNLPNLNYAMVTEGYVSFPVAYKNKRLETFTTPFPITFKTVPNTNCFKIVNEKEISFGEHVDLVMKGGYINKQVVIPTDELFKDPNKEIFINPVCFDRKYKAELFNTKIQSDVAFKYFSHHDIFENSLMYLTFSNRTKKFSEQYLICSLDVHQDLHDWMEIQNISDNWENVLTDNIVQQIQNDIIPGLSKVIILL